MNIGAAVPGFLIGAAVGLAVGVAIDFFHVNIRAPLFFGVALGPSIAGLSLGSLVGLIIGLTTAFMGRARGPSR
jgi:hypothetical protein